jgi:phosphotransferase system enzyme I (PtsI)
VRLSWSIRIILLEKRQINDVDAEIAKLESALGKSKAELEASKSVLWQELGEKKAEIFESHLLILNDPELIDPRYGQNPDESC